MFLSQAVPHILTVSDTELLVLDPKSLQTKYNMDLGDIQRISVTPLKDGIIVFHIRTVGVLTRTIVPDTSLISLRIEPPP